MIDDKVLNNIGQQLGNLGINIASLERDVELLTVKSNEQIEQIKSLQDKFDAAIAERDTLQQKLNDLVIPQPE